MTRANAVFRMHVCIMFTNSTRTFEHCSQLAFTSADSAHHFLIMRSFS